MAPRITLNRPTMADVAREANVSITTVSYVLGGRRGKNAATRISPDTRDRVLAAVERTGYRINQPARNLRRQQTDHVLLIIERLASPYSHQAAADISRVLTEHDLKMSIVVCPDTDRLRLALDMIPGRIADGAIVINPSRPHTSEVISEAASQGVPIVGVGTFQHDNFDIAQPQDESLAVGQAIDHLVARGHRRIAFIGHLADQSLPESRYVSVKQRLNGHGLDLDPLLVRHGARDRPAAHAATIHLMSLPEPPDAIFSASDIGGIATIWAAQREGIHVPNDLAIIGCGNIDECQLSVPTLSSAGPERMDYSQVALQMIDRLAQPDRPPVRLPFERWRFFPRESSQ